MIKIKSIVRTCSACPSQWDMWDKDGNYYYVRYRHNSLTVEMGTSGGVILVDKNVSYGGGGYMTLEDLRKELDYLFDMPLKEGHIVYQEPPNDK